MTRLENKVDMGQAEMQGKILNAIAMTHGAGSRFLSIRKSIISDEGCEMIYLILRYSFYMLFCQV